MRIELDPYFTLAEVEARREIEALTGHRAQVGRSRFAIMGEEVSAVRFLEELRRQRGISRLDTLLTGYVDTDALGVVHPPC